MGRAITNLYLWEQIVKNQVFKQLFKYLESDKKACFEHRKDNKPVLYYDSKKMFVFEAMSRGRQRIRVSFPKYYYNAGSKGFEHIELDDIDNWEQIIQKYSKIQSDHILEAQESLGYKEDRWQFDLVNFFNCEKPGEGDYYVINTEYGQEGDNNRNYVDLVLLHGLKSGKPHIVLCELKYGDNSLVNHGINDHLSQYQGYLDDPGRLERLVNDMTTVFIQRCELGLIKGVNVEEYKNIKIQPDDTTALIVVREHNPRSRRLTNELSRIRKNKALTEIKSRTKIIVYNEGCYDSCSPFNEDCCIEGFK